MPSPSRSGSLHVERKMYSSQEVSKPMSLFSSITAACPCSCPRPRGPLTPCSRRSHGTSFLNRTPVVSPRHHASQLSIRLGPQRTTAFILSNEPHAPKTLSLSFNLTLPSFSFIGYTPLLNLGDEILEVHFRRSGRTVGNRSPVV